MLSIYSKTFYVGQVGERVDVELDNLGFFKSVFCCTDAVEAVWSELK